MQRNMKTVLLTVVTLATAGCAHSDRNSQQAAWRPANMPKTPRGSDAPPPKILPNTHYAAGRLFEQQGSTAKAIDQYRRAVALNHNFAEAYHRLGVLLSVTGQRDEALTMLRRAAMLSPSSAIVHNDLGFELMFQKELIGAEQEFRKAIELTPTYARAHINLGLVLCRQERFDDAYTAFRNVLPEPDAHYNVGLMLRGQQKYAEASQAFRRTLAADARFTAAEAQLAQLERHTPQPVGATDQFDGMQTAHAGAGEPVDSLPAFMAEGFGTFNVTPNSANARMMQIPELLVRPNDDQAQRGPAVYHDCPAEPAIASAASFDPASLLMSHTVGDFPWSDPCDAQLAFEEWQQEERLIAGMGRVVMSARVTPESGDTPQADNQLVITFDQWRAIRGELQRQTRLEQSQAPTGSKRAVGSPVGMSPVGQTNQPTSNRAAEMHPALPPFHPYTPVVTNEPFTMSSDVSNRGAGRSTGERGTMSATVTPDVRDTHRGNRAWGATAPRTHAASSHRLPASQQTDVMRTSQPFGWIDDVDDVHDALSIVRNEIACWDAVIDGQSFGNFASRSAWNAGSQDQAATDAAETGQNYSTLPTFTPAPPDYVRQPSQPRR